MFLIEPDETRYDLRWRMFGTNVRVHPMFWLMSIILGYDGLIPLGFGYVLAWVGCVFVSVLLHEFGHVWMGRLFGSHGHIVLYSFGGLAIGSNALARRWQRILVLLAGPLIQLVLFVALVCLMIWVLPSHPKGEKHPIDAIVSLLSRPRGEKPPIAVIVSLLLEINLIWPILNLLPIWPLDGGQITREVSQAITPARGTAVSLGISMVVSGLLAVHMLMDTKGRPLIPVLRGFGSMWTAIFFALFCVSSFLALQAENERRRQWSDDEWT